MRWLTLLILLSFKLSFAQEPAYFFVGSAELSGVHIYDINQSDNGDYWLATNNGLFKYDGYNFLRLPGENMMSESLFNVCVGRNSEVYCHNLSGQVFHVVNDTCKVFYHIPDSLMSENISMGVEDDGRLLISAAELFHVNKKKQVELYVQKSESNAYYSFEVSYLSDNRKVIYDYGSREIYLMKDTHYTHLCFAPKYSIPRFFEIEGNLIGVDITTAELFYENGEVKENYVGNFGAKRRVYFDGEHLWKTSSTSGVEVAKGPNQSLFEGKKVLENHIVSAVFRDLEGNVVVGTFRDGLIVIPNMDATTYLLPDSDKPTTLEIGPSGEIYVGSQTGKIYKLNEQGLFELFFSENSKFVEYMAYIAETNELVVDDKKPRFFNLGTGEIKSERLGAIKDIKWIDNEKYLSATNAGLFWVDTRTKQQKGLKNYRLRSNAVAYNQDTRTIYAGTSQGLLIGTEETAEYFQVEGENIITTYIETRNDTFFVCTQKKGILLFRDNVLIKRWNTSSGLASNQVNKIVPYMSGFIASTDKGVVMISSEGKTVSWIGKPEGLTQPNVSDIAISNHCLYVSHADAVQKINLAGLQNNARIPELKLVKLEVNDQHMSLENVNKFTYDQNKFVFLLSANTLKYKSEIKYEYMLEGIDEAWQSNSYFENRIVYKSLPPGDYNFIYRSVFRGERGENHNLSFTISAPLWTIWWFWLLVVLVIIASFYFYFSRLIKRQRMKAKIQRELIGSKLTAIQSQMNPHFIFNSLNSIQDLVLRQEGEDAYNYISKFAYLVRKVLAFSDTDFVDVSEEVKLLTVYLELEKLRFNNDFEFQIQSQDADGIQIPPMIVQPFVENAIKHGLLHKSGEKILKVCFSIQEENLHCTIEDNGVGREKSAEIKKRKSEHHTSFSVKSIRSRFDILKSLYGGELGLEFEDLYNEGEPSGTRVTLKLPTKRNF